MNNLNLFDFKTFSDKCIGCGICKKICPFLEKYGVPSEIIKDESESVFLCSNCKACDRVCPESLKPSDALLCLKYRLIKKDKLSNKTKKAIEGARKYALTGHHLPFAFYPSTETAFWPGCSLQSSKPDLVKKIARTLKVGLVLDCCFDPLFHNGDIDPIAQATQRIKDRLNRHGIKRLILGCTNCKKIFSLYLPEIKAEHILEVIPETTKNPKNYSDLQNMFLHHPCPSYRFDFIRKNANEILKGFEVSESQSLPQCCGLGGAAHLLSEEMTDSYTERVLSLANGRTIATYCMGCKNRFQKKGVEAYHILELIFDTKPLKYPLSASKKWLNRFFLATGERLKSKKLLLALFLTLLISITTYLRKSGYIYPELFMDFIKHNRILAPLLFILIYMVGPSLFIPSLPLTVGAGFLWGPFWGVVYSITGATLGASLPFLLARYIFGNTIKDKLSHARWEALEEKVKIHGWKAVAFTRIVPIFPYPVLNYLFGITPIPFIHYLWSTFVFMLPACIAYVAFGSSMGELILKGNIKGIVIGILIASFALLIPLAIKPFFKKLFSENNE